jgi:hypothetical protein
MWVDAAEIVKQKPPSEAELRQGMEYLKRGAKARFYADENFPFIAARILRRLGAQVETVQEAGLCGHPDEDYLDNRRFPLIHCPAIAVFDFGGGSVSDILAAFRCLRPVFRTPQFYDKWTKIDAVRDSWIISSRFVNGTTDRSRYRWHRGNLQEWIDR